MINVYIYMYIIYIIQHAGHPAPLADQPGVTASADYGAGYWLNQRQQGRYTSQLA